MSMCTARGGNRADQAAIKAHLVVPESRAFGKALYKLAAQPPQMEVLEAQEVRFA